MSCSRFEQRLHDNQRQIAMSGDLTMATDSDMVQRTWFGGNLMQVADYFYTEGQVAELMGVTRQTVYRWAKEGKFSSRRVGREVFVPKQEIQVLIKERLERSRELCNRLESLLPTK